MTTGAADVGAFSISTFGAGLAAFAIDDAEEVDESEAAALIGRTDGTWPYNHGAEHFVRIRMVYTMVSDDVGSLERLRTADERGTEPVDIELSYVLELGGEDRVRGGGIDGAGAHGGAGGGRGARVWLCHGGARDRRGRAPRSADCGASTAPVVASGMPFPLTVGGRTVASPPELAALAQTDADGPGGTVVPGQRPCDWIPDLVASGALELGLARGLGAALLQNANAITVAEGARIARALTPSPLDQLVLMALDVHDVVLLLQNDPARPEFSVEDTLLRSAVEVAPLDDDTTRGKILTRLRHAGLPGLELRVLLDHGRPDEVARWMPALLEEELEEDQLEQLRRRASADDAVAAWLLEHVPGLAGH